MAAGSVVAAPQFCTVVAAAALVAAAVGSGLRAVVFGSGTGFFSFFLVGFGVEAVVCFFLATGGFGDAVVFGFLTTVVLFFAGAFLFLLPDVLSRKSRSSLTYSIKVEKLEAIQS